MIIYAKHITARLRYILHALFDEQVLITDDVHVFSCHTGTRINYSGERLPGNDCRIVPHGLLNETGIRPQHIQTGVWDELVVFFLSGGTVPFDIFSASFYLLSRYEEYLPHDKDLYGRYDHTSSIAFREKFLQQPLVNEWMKKLHALLGMEWRHVFHFLPTYDIDIAFKYNHQPVLRNVFGFFKDLVQGNFDAVVERSKVYSNNMKDPFDVFGWLNELHERHHLPSVFFYLVAAERKGVDKNINPYSKGLRSLIRAQCGLSETGLHPSWQSGDDEKKLAEEKNILGRITGRPVNHTRQHFLRLQLPQTYRLLLANGIGNDYSMGYSAVNGFRASYAMPYRWYDLEAETETSLIIHPFCYMDATSIFAKRYNDEQAIHELQQLYDTVKSVDGTFISIFHNHFLTEQADWIVWRNMYEKFLSVHCR